MLTPLWNQGQRYKVFMFSYCCTTVSKHVVDHVDQCYVRIFTGQGRVRRDLKPFFQFLSLPPKTQKLSKCFRIQHFLPCGETEFCLLNKHERRKCKAHRRLTLSLKKRSAVEWVEGLFKLLTNFPNRKMPEDQLNFPDLAAVSCGKKETAEFSPIALHSWIYIYILYV